MTQETKIGVIRSFMGEELTLQEKLTIVRKRYHEHKQQKTIARELCCNQSTVSRVLQQFLSSDGLETKKRSGRPSVVSDEVKGVVDKGIKKRRTATSSELGSGQDWAASQPHHSPTPSRINVLSCSRVC